MPADQTTEPAAPRREPGGTGQSATPRRLRLFGRELPLPAGRLPRIALGVLLVIGGLLGFLPILGFWMLPLGLLILSIDLRRVRRWRRRAEVALMRRWPRLRRLLR